MKSSTASLAVESTLTVAKSGVGSGRTLELVRMKLT